MSSYHALCSHVFFIDMIFGSHFDQNQSKCDDWIFNSMQTFLYYGSGEKGLLEEFLKTDSLTRKDEEK